MVLVSWAGVTDACRENCNVRRSLQLLAAALFVLVLHLKCASTYFEDYESGLCVVPSSPTEHSPMHQPAARVVGVFAGCECRETPGVYVVCYAQDRLGCDTFPTALFVAAPLFKFKLSNIAAIRRGDLTHLTDLRTLEIESHLRLVAIEPGCFCQMRHLTMLTISGNINLRQLEEAAFEGLVSLRTLDLRKNGFSQVLDATRALAPKYVPSLSRLQLDENIVEYVSNKDFYPMNGSQLQHLDLISCAIEYMEPECLAPLKKLRTLTLGSTAFNDSTLTNLIETSLRLGVPLDNLISLYDVGLATMPRKLLASLGAANLTYLSVSANRLHSITDESLPSMPHLVGLDLRANLITSVSAHAFARLPRLTTLLLACNKLSEVPQGALPPTLERLDLAYNAQDSGPSNSFLIEEYTFVNMARLRKLQLSFNNIMFIMKDTFAGLGSLVQLNLKDCALYDIQPGAFSPLAKLLHLNLSRNPGLRFSLTADSFLGLGALQQLLLEDCALTNLTSSPSLFLHMPSLVHLSLANNGLAVVAPNQLAHLSKLHVINLSTNKLPTWTRRIMPRAALQLVDVRENKFWYVTSAMLEDWATAERVDLDGNPLFCDCNLYEMVLWITEHKQPLQKFGGTCTGPERWRSKPLADCLNFTATLHQDCEQRNQTITIILASIVVSLTLCACAYVFRWYFGYWLFLFRMRRHRSDVSRRRATHSYKYDAFVSYCKEDREFTMRFVSELECNEPHFKLCFYERDFEVGADIAQAVLQSVSASRRTLLVISDAFARSRWCRWETQLAEYHQLFSHKASAGEGLDDTLLVVKVGAVSKRNMTPTLKYLLRTRIYLEWEEDADKQRLFWAKLRSALAAPKEQGRRSHTPRENSSK